MSTDRLGIPRIGAHNVLFCDRVASVSDEDHFRSDGVPDGWSARAVIQRSSELKQDLTAWRVVPEQWLFVAAVSGPMIRFSSGRVVAMTAREVSSPPRTLR